MCWCGKLGAVVSVGNSLFALTWLSRVHVAQGPWLGHACIGLSGNIRLYWGFIGMYCTCEQGAHTWGRPTLLANIYVYIYVCIYTHYIPFIPCMCIYIYIYIYCKKGVSNITYTAFSLLRLHHQWNTPKLVGILTRDLLDADASTRQNTHTSLTRVRISCPRRNSEHESQHARGAHPLLRPRELRLRPLTINIIYK